MNIDEALSEAVAKLRAAATSDRQVEAAQMRLINFSDMIRAAGPNWFQVKEKIRTGSISFLRGCLAEEDIVIPCGDGFLIIFASADAIEVTRRTEELRQVLIEFYLGQEGLDRLRVQVTRQALPAKALHALAAEELVVEDAPASANVHRLVFVPVWHAPKQLIASYFCSPVHDGSRGPIYGYEPTFLETGAGEPGDFLATDLEALDRVDAHLQSSHTGLVKPALGLPVHAATMQRRSRRIAYLKRLDQIAPEHARRTYVRISEIPRGTPVTTIADWVGQLRGKVRTVLLQFHCLEPPPIQIEHTGATGAGFAAPLRVRESNSELSRFLRQVGLWAAVLARHRMVLHVDNLRTEVIAQRAAELGAKFLTSETLWPCSERPGEARSAPLGVIRKAAG